MLLFVLTVFAVIGGFLFGYDTGVVSGAEVFIRKDLRLTATQVEVVVSITVGVAAVGAAAAGWPMQKYGRRPIIMVASALYTVGSLVVALAPSLGVLILGRIILGGGVGLSSMSIPVYVAEVAPPRIRGKLVSCYNLFIVLGQAAACGVNIVAEATLGPSLRWRLSMGVAAAPALLQLLGFLALPESPRWLAHVGRIEEARGIVRRLGGDEDALEASDDSGNLREALKTVWREPYLHRIFRLGFGLMVLQQLSGINTIMYFGAEILIMCGFAESRSVALTAALAAAQGTGVVLSMPLFDRLGRRLLIVPSTLVAATCLAIVAAAFGLGIHDSDHRAAALTGVVVYLVAFGCGLSSGPWVVNSEIYPSNVRGLGNAGATTVNWLANYLVSALFLTSCDAIGRFATFAALATVALLGALWVAMVLPETAGKTLGDAELRDLFSERRSSAKLGIYENLPQDVRTQDDAHQPADACPPLAAAENHNPLHDKKIPAPVSIEDGDDVPEGI
ncbi:hypothetical protein CTAYLR_001596 [Chrysophaeum taylorii]|uniref:Hexose transporter 1 n=1 Tax=Chrysophaeum taylorii TaxID=2483200 RepID=A0AAD7UCU1_9STRA|nr:hypothetical protein CTAYLR_001596 [Chrysophaeum taylorii]